MTSLCLRALAYTAAALALALSAACANIETETPTGDKQRALVEFIGAYRLAELWPQMAPKIARDSMPRLEDAARADIDADPLSTPQARTTAQARVGGLLPSARRNLEAALQTFDADELASYTALHVYGKYFDTSEIRAMTAFFNTAPGRKLTALGPTILAESRHAGSGDVMARHFDEAELKDIQAFWQSPLGEKMRSTAEQVREDMHAHFIDTSEPALQAVARTLATQAEADEAPVPLPASAASASR